MRKCNVADQDFVLVALGLGEDDLCLDSALSDLEGCFDLQDVCVQRVDVDVQRQCNGGAIEFQLDLTRCDPDAFDKRKDIAAARL